MRESERERVHVGVHASGDVVTGLALGHASSHSRGFPQSLEPLTGNPFRKKRQAFFNSPSLTLTLSLSTSQALTLIKTIVSYPLRLAFSPSTNISPLCFFFFLDWP